MFNIKKNLKTNGKLIISTINRNLISKFKAIFIAENILEWIPKGTHNYKKFIKPEEIINFSSENNLYFQNLKGLTFNIISNEWIISKNTDVNFFCTISKN